MDPPLLCSIFFVLKKTVHSTRLVDLPCLFVCISCAVVVLSSFLSIIYRHGEKFDIEVAELTLSDKKPPLHVVHKSISLSFFSSFSSFPTSIVFILLPCFLNDHFNSIVQTAWYFKFAFFSWICFRTSLFTFQVSTQMAYI